MEDISKLKIYSVGIVAANKPLSSDIIEATPIEHLPMLNGELTDNLAQNKSEGVDADGVPYKTSVGTTVTVKAKWLRIGSGQRSTAPDVRRGERVILYRFSDVDQFFWQDMADTLDLRKLETIVYRISGTTTEDTTADDSNTYYLYLSTHNKVIHLHTSKANGEPFGYDIQLNTATGFIQIQDDDHNFIKFDSKERQIVMRNKDNSYIDINKKIINIVSTDEINLKTKKITTTAEESYLTANTHTRKAIVDQTGNETITGMLRLNGNLITAGGSGGDGSVSISGSLNINGTVTAPTFKGNLNGNAKTASSVSNN
jgi:hypothetical protein